MTLAQFRDKYLGKQVEFHSYGVGAFNQCVDLINQYINEVLDNHTKDYTEIIGTNAKDFNTKYDPEDFEWIANTPKGVPQEGDIIVWNGRVGGGAGHVGIFLSGDANSFQSLDQNWSKKEYVTLESHNYNNVLGWLRPKNDQEMVSISKAELNTLREDRDKNWNLYQDEIKKSDNLLKDLNQTEGNLNNCLVMVEKITEEDKSTTEQLIAAEKALQPYKDTISKINKVLGANPDASLDDTVDALITLKEQKTKYKNLPTKGIFLSINGTVLIGGDR